MVHSAKESEVYKLAYALAMGIFEVFKSFPGEEKYALTSQIRRSSRSVAMNLREAWAKRRYEAHFVSKLTDCDGECAETDTSLDFARDCGYISIDPLPKIFAEKSVFWGWANCSLRSERESRSAKIPRGCVAPRSRSPLRSLLHAFPRKILTRSFRQIFLAKGLEKHEELAEKNRSVGRILGQMIKEAKGFLIK